MKVIIYTRVSTDEQANKGHGRDYQLEVLRRHCDINNYKIIEEFTEDYSAKDFNRPKWKELESYVKANRKSIDKIIFTKWDRFSRNMEEALAKIRTFDKWGIEINAVEQMLDLTNPDNKMMLSIYLVSPEIENDKISKRTINGMYKAAKEGAWVGRVPYGFARCWFDKYASLAPNNDSYLVKEIFEEVSLGVNSIEQLRKDYKNRGYNRCKQSFYNMLRNRVYTGMTKVPQFEKDDTYWIDGLHEAIVDEKTFNKVQNIFKSKKKNSKFPNKKNENLPLRGFLECKSCGGTLTGSPSKGNGGVYYYYHCRSGCKNRIRSEKAHEMFKNDVLKDISVNDNVLALYREILIDVQRKKRYCKLNNKVQVENKIVGMQNNLEAAEDKLINGDIDSCTFKRISTRYNNNLRDLKAQLQAIKDMHEVSTKMIDKACKTLREIPQLFDDSSYEQKTSLLGLMFPEKLIISKKECRTKQQNIVIELLTRVNKASQGLDKKKAIRNDGLSNYAPPLGLEPRTL
ncbi:recombinase family protein [Aquimarina algiphila]|uniref:recombinase family protein n=1 Tax=Aquimarina algiphila TaxID=2047982 RepID=UPI002330168B|nr:recombinase family protein [Aquimarina algiphila]